MVGGDVALREFSGVVRDDREHVRQADLGDFTRSQVGGHVGGVLRAAGNGNQGHLTRKYEDGLSRPSQGQSRRRTSSGLEGRD